MNIPDFISGFINVEQRKHVNYLQTGPSRVIPRECRANRNSNSSSSAICFLAKNWTIFITYMEIYVYLLISEQTDFIV